MDMYEKRWTAEQIRASRELHQRIISACIEYGRQSVMAEKPLVPSSGFVGITLPNVRPRRAEQALEHHHV